MSEDIERNKYKDKVIKRIQRIEGQLRGVIKMIEEDRGCNDILTQMLAASGAMKGTLSVMIQGNLFECMTDMKVDGKMNEEALEELVKTLSKAL